MQNVHEPVISVVLPAYNAEPFVETAITSILKQTFGDFELIVIDDGSTDKTLEILQQLSEQDKRINVISRPNKGLVATLNEGIKLSNGKFVARMDADDISHPERFERQIEFLKSNRDYAVVGTGYEFINEYGTFIKSRTVLTNAELIKAGLLFGNQLCHPSVMINMELVGKDFQYRDFQAAEDYEIWCRLAEIYKVTNIPDILLKYRVLNTSISRTQSEIQQGNALRALTTTIGKNLPDNHLTNIYNSRIRNIPLIAFLFSALVINLRNLRNRSLSRAALIYMTFRTFVSFVTSK